MSTKLPRVHRTTLVLSGVLSFFLVALCLCCSWYMLLVKAKHTRGCTQIYLFALELISIALAAAGHSISMNLVCSSAPPALVVKALTKVVFPLCGVRKFRGTVMDEESEPSVMMFPSLWSTTVSFSQRRVLSRRVVQWIAVTCVIASAHLVVHHAISSKHRQSQEIVLALVRVPSDIVAFLTAVTIYTRLTQNWFSSVSSKRQQRWRRVAILLLTLVTGPLFLRWAWSIFTFDTMEHLQRCILDTQICNPCEAEGTHLDPALKKSWVWPAITPRRLFTFYADSEACHSTSWVSLGYVDEATETLVVSSTCPDGSKPRVYLELPEENELNGRDDVRLPEVLRGNKQYHVELMQKYGTKELADAKAVIVHRDPQTDLITAVEVKPETMVPVNRAPTSAAERVARTHWQGTTVLEVKLGASPAYFVRCPAQSYEEMFMFPTRLPPQTNKTYACDDNAPQREAPSHTSPGGEETLDEPAGNVLMFIFDAVSRQEVRRSLPKFTEWVNNFSRRHPASGQGHMVVEPGAWTTLGISTSGNFCPYLTGTTITGMGFANESSIDMMPRNIFNIAKSRYGDGLGTSMTVGFCSDFFETILGNRQSSCGSGGRLQGIDHYLYQPMCHLDYTGLESNFQGPYSILRRCIANRHVHEHMLDYTEYLLRRRLRERLAALRDGGSACRGSIRKNQFFFDLQYFIDGHEGTHTVLALVDDYLTAFMVWLETELRFFEDPLNVFIFGADHGNHMGHYYEFTKAGQFERTSPAMVFFIHPEVMNRVDRRIGRVPGVGLRNFLSRTKRLVTPLDFYMTLGDLVGVSAVPYKDYVSATLTPKSLFDSRTGPFTQDCRDFVTKREEYVCSQHFCIPTGRPTKG